MSSADAAKTQNLLKAVLKKMQPASIQAQPRERLQQMMDGKLSFAEFVGVTSEELMEITMFAYNLYKQGRFKEAKAIYESLCELDATESFFFRSLGTTLLAMGDLEGAKTNLDEALRLNARDPDALVKRSEVLLQTGKATEAVKDLQAVIEMDPGSNSPATQRARAIARALAEMIEQQRKAAGTATTGGAAAPAAAASKGAPPAAATPPAAAAKAAPPKPKK